MATATSGGVATQNHNIKAGLACLTRAQKDSLGDLMTRRLDFLRKFLACYDSFSTGDFEEILKKANELQAAHYSR